MLFITPVPVVITEAKNASGLTFNTPSATPVVLLKDLSRPLISIMYCVGPTAPILSGGNAPVSVGPVTPLKERPIV